MKAVVFEGSNIFKVKDVPQPVIQEPTDGIVRITSTTICASDLKILHGQYRAAPGHPHKRGRILGHEGVGIVEEIGKQTEKFDVGDRVVISNNSQCGTCFYCLKGVYSSCEKGGWLLGNIIDGTQAELVRVPYADMDLYKIPEGLGDEDVLPVSDIASTAFFGVERAGVSPGNVVAVFGAGPIGQSVIAIAKIFGASLIVSVDLLDYRLQTAKKTGADITVNAKEEDPVKIIQELTQGRGADVAIEAVGAKATYEYALNAVRPGGSVAILGVFVEPQTLPLPEIIGKNLRLHWGFCDPNRIPELLRLIQGGRLNLRHLFTHTFPLKEAYRAYETFEARRDNVMRVILRP